MRVVPCCGFHCCLTDCLALLQQPYASSLPPAGQCVDMEGKHFVYYINIMWVVFICMPMYVCKHAYIYGVFVCFVVCWSF